jgi:hypothetical protein
MRNGWLKSSPSPLVVFFLAAIEEGVRERETSRLLERFKDFEF